MTLAPDDIQHTPRHWRADVTNIFLPEPEKNSARTALESPGIFTILSDWPHPPIAMPARLAPDSRDLSAAIRADAGFTDPVRYYAKSMSANHRRSAMMAAGIFPLKHLAGQIPGINIFQ